MPPLLDRPWQGAFTSGRIRKVSGLATFHPPARASPNRFSTPDDASPRFRHCSKIARLPTLLGCRIRRHRNVLFLIN